MNWIKKLGCKVFKHTEVEGRVLRTKNLNGTHKRVVTQLKCSYCDAWTGTKVSTVKRN